MDRDDEEELDGEFYHCCCHVQMGSFLFLSLLLLISMLSICLGVANHDDFFTVASLIDFGVVAFALIGNRIKSKTMHQPFFAVHLILTFFLSVISVLLFLKIYERHQSRRGHAVNSEEKNKGEQDYSRPLLLFYILILVVHGYALKVIYRSYLWMGRLKLHKKTNIKALKVLVIRERQKILERAADPLTANV